MNAKSHPPIVLHIGPHKTGSTTLQVALARNRSQLARHGWHYDEMKEFPGGVHEFAARLSKNSDQAIEVLPNMSSRFSHPTVLSSENFSLLGQQQVRLLAAALDFRAVRVVYFLRSPIERIPSLWQESVKHGYPESLDAFMKVRLNDAMADPETNPASQLAPWLDVFGRRAVAIHVLDRVANPVRLFFRRHLGILSTPDFEDRLNKSLSAEEVEILRHLGAGAMEVIARGRELERFRELVEMVKSSANSHAGLYRQQRVFSCDQEPFRAIERILKELVFPRTWKARPGNLFRQRENSYSIIAPDIWTREEHLAQKLTELRQKLVT